MNMLIVCILLYGILISSVILTHNKGYKKSNRYMAGLMFSFSLYSVACYTIFFSHSVLWVALCATTLPSFFFLIGPLAYFYVRSVIRGTVTLSRMDYLHFAAFTLSFLGTLPFLFTSWEHKMELASAIIGQKQQTNTINLDYLLSNQVYGPLNVLHTLLYSFLNWGLLLKNPLKDKHLSLSRNVATIRTWLFFIISIQTVTALGISIFYLDFHIYNNNLAFLPDAHNQVFLASSGYAIFNIALLFSPKIMYGTIFDAVPETAVHTPMTKLYIPDLTPISIAYMEKEAEAHLGEVPAYLSEAYIQKIGASIQQIIDKKEYSDPEFSLQQFSNSYNFPIHHITNYFNRINNVKFTEWRNSLRIQYAVQLINDGALAQTTLETIAARVGFASQNTFIRAFKNEVGQTPREYCKSIRKNL